MVLPLTCIMLIGYLAKKKGLLPDAVLPSINGILYWIAIPALLFRTTLRIGGEGIAQMNLFWAIHAGFLLAPLTAWILARICRSEPRRAAVSVLMAVRSNNVFMGVPAITIAMGQAGLDALSHYLAMGLVGYNAISILGAQLASANKRLTLRSVGITLLRVLANPLIVATAGGLLLSRTSLQHLPEWIDTVLKTLGDTGSGIALLTLGASLDPGRFVRGLRRTGRDVVFKLFIHPVIAWGMFCLWPTEQILTQAVVLVSAMPPAVNNFIIADGMGLDAEYAADVITAGTILSVLTLPLWVRILGIG